MVILTISHIRYHKVVFGFASTIDAGVFKVTGKFLSGQTDNMELVFQVYNLMVVILNIG